MRDSSAGSGPSSAASGMPCTLPLPELDGVFMSPCASTQISPSGLSLAADEVRRRGNRSCREAVIAAEHEREAALFERRERRSCRARRRRARSRGCTSCAGRPRLGFGDRRTRSPSSTTGMPSAVSRSPSPAIRNADGPMSTPRRLPPRSSDTPMMWTGRMRDRQL